MLRNIFGHVDHRGHPNIFFVVLDKVQQFTMFAKPHVDVMPPSYPMEEKDEEGVGLHGFFDKIDHLIGGVAVHGEAVYIVEVDLAQRVEDPANAACGNEVIPQSCIEKGIADGHVAAGIGKSPLGLAVDGVEEDVGLADLGDGAFDGIPAQVVVGGYPISPRQARIAGMEQGVVAELMAFGGCFTPCRHPICHYCRGADNIKSPFEAQAVQCRDDVIQVDVDRVVIGKHYRAGLMIPGGLVLCIAGKGSEDDQEKDEPFHNKQKISGIKLRNKL